MKGKYYILYFVRKVGTENEEYRVFNNLYEKYQNEEFEIQNITLKIN